MRIFFLLGFTLVLVHAFVPSRARAVRDRPTVLASVSSAATVQGPATVLSTSRRGRIGSILQRARDSEVGQLGTAVVTGLTIGVIIKNARMALALLETQRIRFVPLQSPLIGAAVVVLLYLFRSDLGIGAASIGSVDNFSLQRQLLRFFGVLVVVGSGNPLGLAGPAAEMGMTVGRVFSGGVNRIDKGLSRPLILAGAAAGFAANFDAPLAAILYALEVSRRIVNIPALRSQKREVSTLMLAVYAALFVLRGKDGFPTYSRGPLALASYPPIPGAAYPRVLAVGVAAGLLTSFIQGPLNRAMAQIMGKFPKVSRPLLGGAIASLAAAYGFPQSLPAHLRSYATLASGELSRPLLLKLTAIKLLCVQACASSGLLGGLNAPYLIMGSAIGSFAASTSSLPTASFTAVGSAAVLSAFFQAPLTYAVLIVEMTQQLHLAAPLFLVSAVSAATSSLASSWRQDKEKKS